ncbi:uncharacterized protein LOC124606089 [Schistocerca americana]|uniref:uncharacterized protein LOC124606089 n=1 Tax=Schistocerca americana TaxID=7009 RepID=UPI001F50359C|nr:uncharacterized protein LOC124606089 [Schistocerca americana]
MRLVGSIINLLSISRVVTLGAKVAKGGRGSVCGGGPEGRRAGPEGAERRPRCAVRQSPQPRPCTLQLQLHAQMSAAAATCDVSQFVNVSLSDAISRAISAAEAEAAGPSAMRSCHFYSSMNSRGCKLQMTSASASVSAALSCVMLAAVAGALLPPDNTGLVGVPPERDHAPSLNFWVGAPKPPVRPRRKDLHDETLLRRLGSDFDPRWMRRAHTPFQSAPPIREEERPSVSQLRRLADQLPLPESLPAELRPALRAWLVARASCPISFAWSDLGIEFWPRWVRRGLCGDSQAGGAGGGAGGGADSSESRAPRILDGLLVDEDDDGDTVGEDALAPDRHSGDSGGEGAAGAAAAALGAALQGNASAARRACSWPPGMTCKPGVARNLHILRWHCRLRKSLETNKVWTAERLRKEVERRKKRRKKYRCTWLKVPYPVPEDCECACS